MVATTVRRFPSGGERRSGAARATRRMGRTETDQKGERGKGSTGQTRPSHRERLGPGSTEGKHRAPGVALEVMGGALVGELRL